MWVNISLFGWCFLSLLTSKSWADVQLNLTKGVTAVSRDVYDLHMLVLYICTAIGAVVFGAMFWSIAFHRKSKGVKPADFHESTKVEILWTRHSYRDSNCDGDTCNTNVNCYGRQYQFRRHHSNNRIPMEVALQVL